MKAEAPYCYKRCKGRAPLCTTANAPSLERDAQAKQFVPTPDLLTVYVVRQAWGEGWHRLPVSLDGLHVLETVPYSMLRLRVKPGEHRLAFTYEGQTHETVVRGTAGQVVFAGITGTDTIWGSSHRWSDEPAEKVRARAMDTRLVAELVQPN